MQRPRLALVLALVGLVAGVVGAVGPATGVTTTYSWPPSPVPDATPDKAWFSPLLLIRQRPEAISATFPCGLAPALPNAPAPATALATARHPRQADSLLVTRREQELVFAIGEDILARVPVSECPHQLDLGAGAWTLAGNSGTSSRGGDLDAMPIVTGLFSALDLHAEGSPSIRVTTAVHAMETTVVQKLAWVVAALAIAGALLLVARQGTRRRSRRPMGAGLRSLAARAHPADAVVGGVLLAWWVLSPSFYDDGWVLTRQRMFSASRGFSNYYDTLGANVPLGYWLEWVQHWLAQSSSTLLVLRIPVLLGLAGIWIICRWTSRASRTTPSPAPQHPGSSRARSWSAPWRGG